MTRRIIATNYVSLDGVVEDPVGIEGSGLGNWTGPFTRGPEGDRFKIDELAAADAMIYGRRTYEGFAAVWPTITDSFSTRMNALPKYVASRTLKPLAWNNSSLLEGDLVEAVRVLKAAPGGDILIYGSVSIVHALMPAGLIDEYRLMVYPTVLGRGMRLFPAGVPARLQLVDNRQFNDGVVLLSYAASLPQPAADH